MNPAVQPRVLHVITGLHTGGAEQMLCRLLSVASRDRHTVVSLGERGQLGRKIESYGFSVRALGMKPGWPSLRPFLALRQLAKEVRPHVVHGWMYHGCLAATAIGRGARLVWGIHHGADDGSREKRRTRLVVRILATLSREPSAIVYCSTANAQRHQELGFQVARAVVIPNGFDAQQFRPDSDLRRDIRAALGLSNTDLVVGHVARYHPAKDHATFVAAAGRLAGRLPNIHFVMAGPAVHAGNHALQESISHRGLQRHAHLLGEREDVPRLLNAFDVLVSSSSSEAFPLIIGEAMATGLPCVVTDVGDSAVMVGRCGRVVPPRDPAALADAVAELLEVSPSERQRLGQAARRRIVEMFPLERTAERYEALYEGVDGKALGVRHSEARSPRSARDQPTNGGVEGRCLGPSPLRLEGDKATMG